jgi:hypothetical protein
MNMTSAVLGLIHGRITDAQIWLTLISAFFAYLITTMPEIVQKLKKLLPVRSLLTDFCADKLSTR